MNIRNENELKRIICNFFKRETEIILGRNYTTISLPIYLNNRDYIEIFVEQLKSELFQITDRGLTILELEMQGIDINGRNKINEYVNNLLKYTDFELIDNKFILKNTNEEDFMSAIMDFIFIRTSIDTYAAYFQTTSTKRPFNSKFRSYVKKEGISLEGGKSFENLSEIEFRFDFFEPKKTIDIKTFSNVNESTALNAVEVWDSRLRRIKLSNGDSTKLAVYDDEIINWPKERVEILNLQFTKSIPWSSKKEILEFLG